MKVWQKYVAGTTLGVVRDVCSADSNFGAGSCALAKDWLQHVAGIALADVRDLCS